jgi:hypothetical protein
MHYTVYRIIVCSRTKIIMISSLHNFSVRILDADRVTIIVFQILDIKSNYLPGIVQYHPERNSGMQNLGAHIFFFNDHLRYQRFLSNKNSDI